MTTSQNKYIAVEDIPAGTALAYADNGAGLRIADATTDRVMFIAAKSANTGEPVDVYTPNDGFGSVLALAGATIGLTDTGKPWTVDNQGRIVVMTATGRAGGLIDGTGAVGGKVRVFVQPHFVAFE